MQAGKAVRVYSRPTSFSQPTITGSGEHEAGVATGWMLAPVGHEAVTVLFSPSAVRL